MVTINYRYANFLHNVITGKLVTGVPHVLNKTPIDWCSKKKTTVETAIHGSEHSLARILAEYIIDLRINLRYL